MLAGSALVLLAAATNGSGGAGAAAGTGMSAMLIDMDPFRAPANTATSLGPNETCARINENGTLDADEDSVADTLVIDVTAREIPQTTAIMGYNYSLRYDERALTLQSETWNDPATNILASTAGSNLFNPSQPLPDVDGSNSWDASMLDVGDAPGESGSGVLTRLTISSDAGAAAGGYRLSLANTVHLDSVTAYPPGNVNVNWDLDENGQLDGIADVAEIAVNQPCGGPPPPGGTVTVGPTRAATPAPGDGTPAGATGGGTPGGPSAGSPTSGTPRAGTGSPSGTTDGVTDNGGGGSDAGVVVAVLALGGGALAAAAGGGWVLYRRRKSGTS